MNLALNYYRQFLAMSNHFSSKSNYDISKYGMLAPCKEDTFNKKKFRWQFNNLSKKNISDNEMRFLFYQVFKDNEFSYLNGFTFCSLVNKSRYKSIQETRQNVLIEIDFIIEEDILYDQTDDMYPKLYRMYKDSQISLETMLVIDKKIEEIFVKENSRDILVWPDVIKRMNMISVIVLSLLEDEEFNEQLQIRQQRLTKTTQQH